MADLLTGADSEGFEDYNEVLNNFLKNHWYQVGVIAALTGAVDGIIVVEAANGKTYVRHIGSFEELLQLTRSKDTNPQFNSPKFRGLNIVCNNDQVVCADDEVVFDVDF